MPTINKMMGIGSFGFLRGLCGPAGRLALALHALLLCDANPTAPRLDSARQPRPAASFYHFDAPVTDVQDRSATQLRIDIAWRTATCEADYVLILGTGFTTDPLARTEFGDDGGRDPALAGCLPPARRRTR